MQSEASGNRNILTAQEVGRLLKIPLSTVYDLTKKKTLHGIKVGKHWRYLETEIQNYLLGFGNPGVFAAGNGNRERRLSPRINCELTAKLQTTLSRKLEPELYGAVHNLSRGGALFVGGAADETHIATGDPVVVGFEIPGAKPRWLEVPGRVVRSDCEPSFAIKFKNIPSQIKEAIEVYVG